MSTSTVVQTSYSPQLKKAYAGMIADVGNSEAVTKICNSTAIGYGVAVSQSAVDDKFAVLGGTPFLGISARDVTLDGMPIDQQAIAHAPADTFDQYRNMAVMTRGRVWVVADAEVSAGDAVYYDINTGTLGNTASGREATGFITLTAQPQVGDTVTIGGVAFTAVALGATPSNVQFALGNTFSQTIVNIVAQLNASANGAVSVASYEAYPPSRSAEGYNQINISYDTPGVGGNALTVATNIAGATVSGATLAGGYGGEFAAGNITFTINPTNLSKITLNGTDVVFASSASGAQVQIGGDLATTLASLKTKLNATGGAPGNDAQVIKCAYDVTGGTVLTVTSKTPGTTNNAFTLATNVTGATRSGATLTGGTVGAISVPLANAWWATTALAGDLAIVSLSE